jgi:hypothetical protein
MFTVPQQNRAIAEAGIRFGERRHKCRSFLFLTIGQAVSSTLAWIGFYAGIRALPGGRARQSRWIIGSAVVAAAWLVGVLLLGAAGAFRNDALPPRIPMALAATRLPGYLLLLSPTFRRIVAAVPQHWLIGIQTFRILGSAWLVRYFAGQLPGSFALPAGIGDVATGLLAPFVAYAWYSGKPTVRGAAIAWNLFGMADLVNAVALGALTNGGAGASSSRSCSSRPTACRARFSSTRIH